MPMDKKERLIKALSSKRCLKVIAGIANFDKANVMQIVGSAYRAGAAAVDISAREDIVQEVIATYSDIPVFVSSVQPKELRRAMELGADVLELGNFEVLYEQGIYIKAEEVIKLTEEVLSSVKFNLDAGLSPLVSITIPGHLDVSKQVQLAMKLDAMGVDIIQTEGAALMNPQEAGALGQLKKVTLTLANTIELSKVLERSFLLTASGISPETAPLAIASGANGVGVGKYVNKLESEIEMIAAARSLVDSLKVESKHKDLVESIIK